MGRAFNAVACVAAIGITAGITHNKGLWSSSIVDGSEQEDQLFRFGALPCGALHTLPDQANELQIATFIEGCDYDQWCVTDPVFSDQSGATQIDHEVCSSIANMRMPPPVLGVSLVTTNLEAFPITPNLESSDSDGITQIVGASSQPLDSLKLHKALDASPEACALYIDGIKTKMENDLNEAAAFTVEVAIRVSPGRNTSCDDPSTTIYTDDRGSGKS